MRYVISMVAAIIVALLATLFVSGHIADIVVARNTFESPDEVEELHAAVFMASNIAALLIGWVLGWLLGGIALRPKKTV